MSAFSPERIQVIVTDTVKLLSSFRIELFTTVLLTGCLFIVHKLKSLKSMYFPFEKVNVKFLYHNKLARLFLTEEGATIWTIFFDPYKSEINKKHSIVQNANQIFVKPEQLIKEQEQFKNDSNQIVDEQQKLKLLKHDYINTVPLAKLYKGLLLQGYCVSPKFLLQLENFQIREDDVFIVSYPRSGTTWTEELVSSIYSQDNLDALINKPIHMRVIHIEVGRLFGQEEWLNSLPSPRLLATHLPYSHVPKQLQELKCKIIYVARNIKDQAVSYHQYHKTAVYLGGKKRDWKDFLKLYENGELVYGSWFDHVIPWYKLSLKHPDKIMFLTYEQLNQNLSGSVRKISTFLKKPVSDEMLNKIVNKCTFDQMKLNNNVNRVNIPLKSFIDQTEIKFMRKGIIGDWKNFFSQEESERFDKLYEEKALSKGLKMAFTDQEAKKMYC